jgi:hypothetical protein
MNRLVPVFLAGVLALAPVGADPVAVDATIGAGVQAAEGLSTKEHITSRVRSSLFDLDAAITIANDGQYGADIAYLRGSNTFGSNYILMDEGSTTLRLRPVSVQVGRVPQRETYDSPYSLFLNSQGTTAFSALLTFDSPSFAYESRWLLLNDRSNFGSPDHTPEAWRWADGAGGNGHGFPDRGANLKTFLFRWGTMRLGLQEATVFTKRTFDPAFFFNPVPEYFTQYLGGTSGRPWTSLENDNYLMGLFWDWREPGFSLGGQVLIDDFSFNFLGNSLFPNNPWKAAWTVGGTLTNDLGTWGFYHAGALKYTFEPVTTLAGSESDTAYGNTYYPDVEFWARNSFHPLAIEDNSLGYLHGENNLALMVTWERAWDRRFRTSARGEYLVAGTNSPANPWGDGTGDNQSDLGTHWLDDPVLEQSAVWTGEAVWVQGDWEFRARAQLGVVFHVLELSSPTGVAASASALDRFVKLYRPSDRTQPVASLFLGATWHWDLAGLLATLPPPAQKL